MKPTVLFVLCLLCITFESNATYFNDSSNIIVEDSITDKKLLRQQRKLEQAKEKELKHQQRQKKEDSIKQNKENRRNEKLAQKENQKLEKTNKKIQDSIEKVNKKIEKQKQKEQKKRDKNKTESSNTNIYQNTASKISTTPKSYNNTSLTSSSLNNELTDDTYNNVAEEENDKTTKKNENQRSIFTNDATTNLIIFIILFFIPHIIIQVIKAIIGYMLFGEKCPHCKNRKVRVIRETDLGITKQDVEYHKDDKGRDTNRIKSIQSYHRYRIDKYCKICNHEFYEEVERKA